MRIGIKKNTNAFFNSAFIRVTPRLVSRPFQHDLDKNHETTLHLARLVAGGTLGPVVYVLCKGESLSAAGIKGATITSLILAALLFSLAYAPSLFWLRKRLGGCRPAALLPVASALILNLPVFLIAILAIGRTLGAAEAFAFIGAFVLMGTAFGLAFVWSYQNRDIKSARWR